MEAVSREVMMCGVLRSPRIDSAGADGVGVPQKRRIASQWLLRQVSKRVRRRIADAGIRSRLSKSASYSIQGKRASPPRGVDGNRRVSAESVSLEAEGCPECRLKAAWHSYP